MLWVTSNECNSIPKASASPTESQWCGRLTVSKDAYKAVAGKLELSDEEVSPKIGCGSAGKINPFHRSVRWAKQKAKMIGLIEDGGYGIWNLTVKGKKATIKAEPGESIVVFQTSFGVGVWADCMTAVDHLEDGEVNLFFTSSSTHYFERRHTVTWIQQLMWIGC